MSRSSATPTATATAAFRRTARLVATAALTLAAGAAPLLLPTPASADTHLVIDGFDRTLTSGWGTPHLGSAWTDVTGGRSTSVARSEGTVSQILGGRSFKAYQSGVSVADAVVRAEFTVPVAKNFQYTVEARRQADGSSYFGRARIDARGILHLDTIRSNARGQQTMLKEMTLDTPVPVGQRLVLKLSTTGSSPVIVRGKVYVKGADEPGWQVTSLDADAAAIRRPGHAGLQAFNGGGNRPVDLTTQAFVVTDVTPQDGGKGTDAGEEGSTTVTAPEVAHGAGPVGSAQYPVPANALFVAPTGDDKNPGTRAAPFKTLSRAVTKNWSGQTIVLRAGTYHESVLVPPGHAATIQPYPGEKVWFDGTSEVTGFQRRGSAFVAGGYDVRLDATPGYTKGQADGTQPGWQWLNPEFPMAAHPDMVWLDGVEQEQVKSLALVTPGTFYVDQAGRQLYLGSDPSGRTVRSATLQTAFSLRAPGTVLRGFGIRRYADSVWQQGVVTSYFDRQTLDDMTVLDSATGGIGFFKPGSVIKNTTVAGSGQVGIHANHADDLVMDNVSVLDSNDENFNPAPSAGGIKITSTRGVTLRNSEILRTHGNQFWTDQSVFNTKVINNEIIGGSRYGVVLEISSTGTIMDNIIAGNGGDGVLIANTDKVAIWNNTIVGNKRAIAFSQDSRRIEQLGVAGHDTRRPQPDLTMPWVIGNSSVANNVLAAGQGARSVFSVEGYELQHDAGKLKITSNGNVYSQTALGVPNATAVWARKGGQPFAFVLLEDFRDNTGQERSSINPMTATPVTRGYAVKASITAQAAAVAQPLPSYLAARAGRPAGVRALGAPARPAS